MKYVLLVAVVLTLSACKDGKERTFTENGTPYYAECVEGVQYWILGGGQSRMMAPRIDSQTLTFVRCEGKQQ